MAVFSVDTESVDAATNVARATGERVRSDVAMMMATLTQLEGTWTGAAAAGFQGQVENWRATQRVVEESLDSLGAALAQASRAYADTEVAASGMFR